MREVFICAYKRTAIGRFGGGLSSVRADDLAAVPLRHLKETLDCDWDAVDDVVLGCANQAGEDNRNIARMALLLAGFPAQIPGTTVNRLCGSGMDAVLIGSRTIVAGQADLIIAGGAESMSRAPFVMPKATSAFSRQNEVHDTTIGWRFVNSAMDALYGTDSMPETAENVAEQFSINREDQDLFALHSQRKAISAQKSGRLDKEICPVSVPQRRGEPLEFQNDEHPRETNIEKLGQLRAPFRGGGSVTAGNASGINDGSAALVLASEQAIKDHQLTPIARIIGGAVAGVEPRIMGVGPVAATQKLLARFDLSMNDFSVIEINEAFAAQVLASMRALGVKDDDPRINPNGGAIALGHPLGMSGARITGSAALQLQSGELGLATMCIGVGQGIAIALQGV